MELILSGYGSTPSNTIAHYIINQDSIQMPWQTSIEDASFICEGDGYLFAVTETEAYAVIYLLQRSVSGFQLLDERRLKGGYLCHITYSSVNKALFGACYGTGTVFVVQVEGGRFGELLFHESQTGEQPGALTRAHCVLLNREESMLIVINIALDMAFYYKVTDGRLAHIKTLTMPGGTGPRHAIYSMDEKLLYIITEYANEIFVYENTDEMKLIQRVSTLAPGFAGISNCSTLCFSQDGNYLYAANRGADTIAIFTVRKDSTLEWLKDFDCGGKHPRHMIMTKDGQYLIVCNQFSDNVAIFELETVTGTVKSRLDDIYFKAPSGVLNAG